MRAAAMGTCKLGARGPWRRRGPWVRPLCLASVSFKGGGSQGGRAGEGEGSLE